MTIRTIEHEPRDPIAFDPVPRSKTRHDGWTAKRQREFIATLAETGNVRQSCAALGLEFSGAYRLRAAPGGASFAAAWDAAVERGTAQIRDLLIDHSLNGVPEPIVAGGKIVGERRKFNHRTMMWMVDKGDKARAARQPEIDKATTEKLRGQIRDQLDSLFVASFEGIINDPAKRAAHEILQGPQDWDAIARQIALIKSGARRYRGRAHGDDF